MQADPPGLLRAQFPLPLDPLAQGRARDVIHDEVGWSLDREPDIEHSDHILVFEVDGRPGPARKLGPVLRIGDSDRMTLIATWPVIRIVRFHDATHGPVAQDRPEFIRREVP